jgi:serine/threonine protein kinase
MIREVAYSALESELIPKLQGTLGNGEAVAVKKLNLGISDRAQSQFVAEVKFITSVQHRNLIRLHGYCVDSADRILVYEFLPNLSLDKHIFSKLPE